MHIKKLTIQGFKSYRDVVAVDPFSEKVNIVVGRNGAGKSNFFAAIRFVLSDAYTSLTRAERQDLLHDGTSTAATFSAFVEIVFDNTDGRIPTGKNEVILRRTIGAKKDDYSLDRKSTSKAEVMSLLESAGFSRSNPFFIVPQGRITSLTNQKDAERLELLKEIAGTRVYEDRKAESEKIMAETEQKQVKIDELLEYIDERLEELEEEKKELKEFQVADKERRSTEYCIYQHQLEEAKEALDELEAERNNEQQQAEEMRQHSAQREAEMTEIEQNISEQREKLDLVRLEKEQLESDQRENIKAKTNVELTIKDLEDASERTEGEREALLADRLELEEAIEAKEQELAALSTKFTRLVEQEAAVKKEIEQAEAKQQSLFAKQGRAAQFRTQAERDRFLRGQITSSKKALEGREKASEDVQNEIENTQHLLEDRKKREVELRQTLEQRREDAKKFSDELNDLNAQSAKLNEERKEGWKADEKLTQTLTHARDELKKAENALRMTMDRATQQGLEAVERVAARFHLGDKVYGPLYKLFEYNDTFKTAIENIANNSLFHVVVDDDETASRILDVMVKEKLGRVTFMPLNRLRPPPVTYPQQEEEAIPLINRLRFEERFRPAMRQVFGKAIIVQNLEVGAAFARSHGLTAITLQGDKQDRKGALTGGFHDSRRSRLETVKSVKQWRAKYDADATQQSATKQSQRQLDQQITELKGQILVAERRLRQAREAREPMTREIAATERDIEQNQSKLADLRSQAAELTTQVTHLKIEIAAQEDELKIPMSNALTDAEAATLTQLGIDLQRHKKEYNTLSKDRQDLAGKKSLLEIEIGQNLRRKRDKIKEKIDSLAEAGGDGPTQLATELTQRRATLESLTKAISTTSEKIRNLDREIEKVQRNIADSQKELETLQSKQAEDSRGFAKQQKNVERFLTKRQLLITRKDDSSKKIRELGAIPPEAFEKQKKKFSLDKLAKDLHKANEKLKKFTGVNKRAFDQFNEFTNQREDLAGRRVELDKSEESIRELIDHLDMRKDEAIERTFKQVSKNFVQVFETLVPAGRGRLIMQKRIDDAASDEEEEEEEVEEDDEEDDEEGDGLEGEEDDGMDVDGEDGGDARKKRRKAKAAPKSKGKTRAKKSGRQSKSAKKAKSKGKKPGAAIEAYSGISIKVSFNSKSDEGLRIQQLSGGQKSLVALALIFSIQKCDPAPFYLFDEIDANLDADRRTAVAAMIRSLADSAQFIITTFRPELLASADNFFGVMFDNRRVSTIQKITRDHAYEFVESASAPANAGPNGR